MVKKSSLFDTFWTRFLTPLDESVKKPAGFRLKSGKTAKNRSKKGPKKGPFLAPGGRGLGTPYMPMWVPPWVRVFGTVPVVGTPCMGWPGCRTQHVGTHG